MISMDAREHVAAKFVHDALKYRLLFASFFFSLLYLLRTRGHEFQIFWCGTVMEELGANISAQAAHKLENADSMHFKREEKFG